MRVPNMLGRAACVFALTLVAAACSKSRPTTPDVAAAKTGVAFVVDKPVALARSHKLPEDAPILIFALGRIVGWIAHALEQYASGELIRPRANYKGPPPES